MLMHMLAGKIFSDMLRSKDNAEYPMRSGSARKGDIICVSRYGGLYNHYGVYAGSKEVIHYNTLSSEMDISDDAIVMQTSMRTFLNGNSSYYILQFPRSTSGKAKRSSKLNSSLDNISDISISDILDSLDNGNQYRIYSAEETVERARSCLGEDGYSLAFNNCEHFALWCKTGIRESRQVKKFLSDFTSLVACGVSRIL